MKRGFRQGRLLVSAVLTLTLGMTGEIEGQGGGDCRILQVTHAQAGDTGALSFLTDVGGGRVAFVGRPSEILGTGGDDREVFLFDPSAPAASALTQITTGAFSPEDVRLDAAGRLLAYQDSGDPVGENPDGGEEIFLIDVNTGVTRQLTHGATDSRTSNSPDLSGDGTRIAFASFTDLHGGSSSDVYILELATGVVTQITNNPAGSGLPRLNHSGTRVAFGSNGDLVPGSNPSGMPQMFLADLTAGTLRQVGRRTLPGFFGFSLDGSGERLVLSARDDLVPGQNPDESSEIFLYDAVQDRLSQITNFAGSAFDPVITPDGKKILFTASSTPSPAAEGGAGSYFYEIDSGRFQKIGLGSSFRAGMNEDGSLVSVVQNDGQGNIELFVAFCAQTVLEVPALDSAGLALLALALGAVGLRVLRRRFSAD